DALPPRRAKATSPACIPLDLVHRPPRDGLLSTLPRAMAPSTGDAGPTDGGDGNRPSRRCGFAACLGGRPAHQPPDRRRLPAPEETMIGDDLRGGMWTGTSASKQSGRAPAHGGNEEGELDPATPFDGAP